MSNCKQCSKHFKVTEQDYAFYEKISPIFNGQKWRIPEPTLCPECRQQRRLSWRNEKNLYKRKCALSGKNIISVYKPETNFTVYGNSAWYSDAWDACEYGRDFDFSRPFFEQFAELQQEVPRLALAAFDIENSPYVNQCWHVKNCHLCFDVGYCEDMLYCYTTYHSSDCIDTLYGEKNELCYGIINCKNCYNCCFVQDSKDCSDTYFSFDCHNSQNLLFCENLHGKEYYIRNKKVSPKDFKKVLSSLSLHSYSEWSKYIQEFRKRKKKAFKKENRNINAENCTGNDLFNCKNCFESFECYRAEDSKYITRGDHEIKDCMDCDHLAEITLSYEGLTISGYHNLFCHMSYLGQNSMYCDINIGSKDCFGCVGIRKKQYCILNKQYSQKEYESLVVRIIKHMKEIGEWGEFFDPQLSPFGYNETLANYYYPLSCEQALSQNFHWFNTISSEIKIDNSFAAEYIADSIYDVSDDILTKPILCEITGKPFKITAQELRFYKKNNIPLPRKHPDQRFLEYMELRTHRKLWKHSCGECKKQIHSTYLPDDQDTVLCVKCYQEKVY